MKILLIGHSVIDNVELKGEVKISPGGLIYSAAALAQLKKTEDEIYLITALDEKNNYLFLETYKKFNDQFIYEIKSIPHVRLNILEDGEREERYLSVPEELIINDFIELNSFDGIYINMISGLDLSLNTLKKLRANYNGLIYLDVHSLAKGFEKNNRRCFGKIPNANEWIANVDLVQANTMELQSFTEIRGEGKIAEFVLNAGSKTLVVTKGKYGARIYTKKRDEIYSLFLSSLRVNTINNVGCGDVFGAAFFYSYICGRNLIFSLQTANSSAGLVTTYATFEDYKYLNDDLNKRIN
jgi:sugar/nucleoside kinase (ribokinase family)